jgi:hypothetical protein
MNFNRQGAIVPCLFVLLAACGGETLFVGTGAQESTGGGAGSGGEPVASTPSCDSSYCTGFQIACSDGSTPTNLTCAQTNDLELDVQFCVLTGQCTAATTDAAAATLSCASSIIAQCVEFDDCPADFGGSGYVMVEMDRSTSPVSSVVSVNFNRAAPAGSTAAFGDCVYDSEGADTLQSTDSWTPASSPGTIEIATAGTSSNLFAEIGNQCDGLYEPITVSSVIAPGTEVGFTFGLNGSDNSIPNDSLTVAAPHVMTLGASDLLARPTPTLPRNADVNVSWTFAGTPLAGEKPVVQLTQGNATLTCTFDASAGQGVIPADGISMLAPDPNSPVTYDVFALHELDNETSPNEWTVHYQLKATALTPSGTAKGSLTVQ